MGRLLQCKILIFQEIIRKLKIKVIFMGVSVNESEKRTHFLYCVYPCGRLWTPCVRVVSTWHSGKSSLLADRSYLCDDLYCSEPHHKYPQEKAEQGKTRHTVNRR